MPVDASFSTALYVDEKLAKTWTFSPISEEEDPEHATNRLMPGGTRIYQYDVTFSGGTHKFRWVVDTKNEINESDESNKSNELQAVAAWKAKSDPSEKSVANRIFLKSMSTSLSVIRTPVQQPRR